MKFVLFSAYTLQQWDWNVCDTTGIGGSEMAHLEMAKRLAKRGHEVISYIPFGGAETKAHGVIWRDSASVNNGHVEKMDGYTWIIYRTPSFFDLKLPKGKFYFVAQDTQYGWTEEQLAKLDGYICLCEEHCKHTFKLHRSLDTKIFKSSNGIAVDLIRKIEKEKISRNNKKIIYASSPDRGLELILKDWFRVIEQVPDAELHIFYGRNNMEKILEMNGDPRLQKLAQSLDGLIQQPNVFWHGRINRPDLLREMFSSGIWYYPTDWPETSCCACMEMQACGVLPITNKFWALKQNILNGVCLSGVPQQDNFTRASLVYELIHTLQNPIDEEYRKKMMEEARKEFNWDKFVKQFEGWGTPEYVPPPVVPKKYRKKRK